MKSPRLKHIEYLTATLTLFLLLVGFQLPRHFSISTTPSLYHRVFFLCQVPPLNTIKTGDYLVFSQPETISQNIWLSETTAPMIKMVGCLPEEHLLVDQQKIICEDVFLGTLLEKDSKGHPLPKFIHNGTVPPGKLFMIGQHAQSFDSRYFGFVDAKNLLYKAIPIW
jgi:conjugative transfer signal peptidase TraF